MSEDKVTKKLHFRSSVTLVHIKISENILNGRRMDDGGFQGHRCCLYELYNCLIKIILHVIISPVTLIRVNDRVIYHLTVQKNASSDKVLSPS